MTRDEFNAEFRVMRTRRGWEIARRTPCVPDPTRDCGHRGGGWSTRGGPGVFRDRLDADRLLVKVFVILCLPLRRAEDVRLRVASLPLRLLAWIEGLNLLTGDWRRAMVRGRIAELRRLAAAKLEEMADA